MSESRGGGDRPRKERFPGFDYLRVVGILAVIYIHGCDTNAAARQGMNWLVFAVPCFFLMSVFLAQRSVLRKELSYRQWIWLKFKRLAPAFFLWSSVYVAFRLLKSLATGEQFEISISGVIFLGDASYQLYFVPILFYGLCLSFGAMRLERSHPRWLPTVLVAAIVLFVLIDDSYRNRLPADRWFLTRNLVWFPAGILASCLFDQVNLKSKFTCVLSIIGLATLYFADRSDRYLVTAAAFTLALSINRESPDWIKLFAKYSYGVYLVHVLFVEGLQFASPKFGLTLSDPLITSSIILVTTVLSFGTCLILGQFQRTRWCVT